MSEKSDRFEQSVADTIKANQGMDAKRPPGDTRLSDILITKYKDKTVRVWVEAKMGHSDNLANPRVFYKNGRWDTTYTTPVAEYAVKLLNRSSEAEDFINKLSEYTGIPKRSIKVPTTKGGLSEEGAVPLHIMKAFFDRKGVNRYIANDADVDVADLVASHYTVGKKEPAYYMQAGDDFYLISSKNPLRLDNKIPKLAGRGDFKVRVGTRSEYYEVQIELKIKTFEPKTSPFSVFGDGKKKKNPFA
jgi:hypothetical protein